MDWTITKLDGLEIIRIELRGNYDLSANPRLLIEVGSFIKDNPTSSLLFDNRRFSGGQMTPNEMVVSSGLFADSSAGISCRRIAILTLTDVEAGKAEQWGRITHSHSMARISVFRDEDAALKWLSE